MMRTDFEKEALLRELLDAPEEFKRGILAETLQVARQRHHRRRTLLRTTALTLPMMLVAALLIWALQPRKKETQMAQVIAPPALPEKIEGTSIRVIDDEELLEMLAGRPVAVVGSGENRQIILLDQQFN